MRLATPSRAAAVAAVVILTACASRGRPPQWTADGHLGIVVATPARACLSIESMLAPRTPVRIADPVSRQHAEATVVGVEPACLPAGAPESVKGYTIAFDGPPPRVPFIGVGSIGTANWRDRSVAMAADVDGDGREEFLRACTSREGVHFTVWHNAAMTGARVWHRYHYLGYDVDPTCTPRETGGGS